MTIAEKLAILIENEPKVYEAGYEAGKSEGGNDSGYYDAFWDSFQVNGERTNYKNAFCNWKKAHNYWKPKYDINPIEVAYMFDGFESDLGLPELCEKSGISINWSNVPNFSSLFVNAYIPDVGVIDTTHVTRTNGMCSNAKIGKIHLKLKEDGSQTHMSTFMLCELLTEITIEGVIGKDFDVSACTNLSTESLINIIEHLGGSESATLTLPVKFKTDEYTDIIASKPSNWTISWL